jgi:hypothetical protein
MDMHLRYNRGYTFVGEVANSHKEITLYRWVNQWELASHIHSRKVNTMDDTPIINEIEIVDIEDLLV